NSRFYHKAQRDMQEQFDSVRLADRLEQVKVHAQFTESDRAFIHAQEMFFFATVSPDGQPSCSYKGGAPGFVRVVDDATLVFPWYDGNGMFVPAGSISATHKVGLLFSDFSHPRRLRPEGTASLDDSAASLGMYVDAQFVVRVSALRIYPNWPRYIHRMQHVEASPYVPQPGITAPIPEWKQSEWARDVLPQRKRE